MQYLWMLSFCTFLKAHCDEGWGIVAHANNLGAIVTPVVAASTIIAFAWLVVAPLNFTWFMVMGFFSLCRLCLLYTSPSPRD